MFVVYANDCKLGWRTFSFNDMIVDEKTLLEMFHDPANTGIASVWIVPGTFDLEL